MKTTSTPAPTRIWIALEGSKVVVLGYEMNALEAYQCLQMIDVQFTTLGDKSEFAELMRQVAYNDAVKSANRWADKVSSFLGTYLKSNKYTKNPRGFYFGMEVYNEKTKKWSEFRDETFNLDIHDFKAFCKEKGINIQARLRATQFVYAF